jgi:hypothetical protein
MTRRAELGDIGQALSNFTGSLGGQGSYFTNRDFDVSFKLMQE